MHDGGVWEVLGQEIAGHTVIVFPLFSSFNFAISGLGTILWLRARFVA